ncbi:pantetheine-phosphate adenylyltransferase-like protein [Xylariaceae sp. FL0016]|nr:pantetheine-phosphate adenylyltransferase-like protein [Xylariaceae sp. FL0016]
MTDHQSPSLLLLPPPPHPASRAALKAAFEPPLRATISRLKDEATGEAQVLIASIASPALKSVSSRQKALCWSDAQSILAGVYSIVSVICAQLAIPTDIHAGPGSVDVRVILVDHDLSKPQVADLKPALEPNNTVVVDLATFACAYHPWRYVFHASNEPGCQLLATYLKTSESVQTLKQDQIIAVQGGLSLTAESAVVTQPSVQPKTFPVVCLGGTFDHLHPGHKLLLTAAVLLLDVPERTASEPCRFIIGVTGDELLKRKKYADLVQSWDERASNIIEFLSSMLQLSKHGWDGRRTSTFVKKDDEIIARFRDDTIEIQCVVIQDAYGPTITAENMDALVVSGETRSGGKAVNERRAELGWRLLEIFEVDVLDAEDIVDSPTKTQDFATKISSTAIRQKKAESRI